MVTFSDNADHQNTLLSMFEQLVRGHDIWAMVINAPKIDYEANPKLILADCPPRPGICKQTFHVKSLLQIIRFVRSKRFDAIYFESLHSWNLPVMLAAPKSTKTYQVIHDCVPHAGDPQEKSVNLMNAAVAKLASKIVVRSDQYQSVFCSRYHIDESKVKVLELWRRWPDYNAEQSHGRMLFFGRINAYKGIDNLIQIVKACPEIQFDVVGRADDSMKDRILILKQFPNVHLVTGYVMDSEMNRFFTAAECVVLPYRTATQSGVIVDAYKLSRPVIAIDVGAISSQVENGCSGFLIPDGDNDAFIKKVKEVHAFSEEQKTTLSRQAYEFGKAKYSAALARSRFLELFAEP